MGINGWKRLCLLVILLLALGGGGPAMPAAAQSDSLGLHLEWPNEGETFYAGPSSLLYSIPVKGRVDVPGVDAAVIVVHLEILQNGDLVSEVTRALEQDGTFEFFVTVNPDGSDGRFPAEHLTCGYYCHLPGSLDLPAGAVTLRITAVSSQTSQQAQIERHITVDRSAYTAVPILVQLANAPEQPVSGVKINASTWLYMWRSRSFTGVSDEQGQATIRAEALTAAPTEYLFRVEPTVVDGVLYEGVTTAELMLAPGETAVSAPLTLTVEAHTGQVTGTVSGVNAADSLPVWAIRLPTGERYQTTAEQGLFAFSPLPIDRYLLAMDDAALIKDGLTCVAEEVDLLADYAATAEISLTVADGLWVNGRVLDENGLALPFAWVTPEQIGATRAVLPASAAFLLSELPAKAIPLLVSAPGYYSRASRVDLAAGPARAVEIALTPQPGTQKVSWGDGAVIVPAESQAEVTGSEIVLENGWLWGHGDGEQPVVIRTAAADISLFSGEFALEYLPGKRAWLYVMNGRVQVRDQSENATLTLQSGQMVNLFNNTGFQAVPLDPVVVSALNQDQASPLPFIWEPTLSARIRNQVARVGINTAQVVTFITYSLVLTSLFIVPLLALYWWWKNKGKAIDYADPKGLS